MKPVNQLTHQFAELVIRGMFISSPGWGLGARKKPPRVMPLPGAICIARGYRLRVGRVRAILRRTVAGLQRARAGRLSPRLIKAPTTSKPM